MNLTIEQVKAALYHEQTRTRLLMGENAQLVIERNAAQDAIRALGQAEMYLFQAIRHGDPEYQAWLDMAISKHFNAAMSLPAVQTALSKESDEQTTTL